MDRQVARIGYGSAVAIPAYPAIASLIRPGRLWRVRGECMDQFETIMDARANAWRPALSDTNPAVRAFAETHVFGEFGFAARAHSRYLEAGCGDAGIQAVYALLMQNDCPLLHAFDSRELYAALMPYFVAEFCAAPPWSLGWQHLVRVMPKFMVLGMRRMIAPRSGGFSRRNKTSSPHTAKFD